MDTDGEATAYEAMDHSNVSRVNLIHQDAFCSSSSFFIEALNLIEYVYID